MSRLVARICLCVFFVVPNLSCSVNILETFADKNTNEAYYVDALKLINDGYYTEALEKIDLMTGSYPSSRKVLRLKADAYGGLCGINFLSFVEAFAGLTGTLMPFLMSTYRTGTLTNADACKEAEDIIESIAASADRTNDEHVRMMVIGFAKIGNILGHYADTDDDGTADAGYNVCLDVGGTDISDAYAREVGTGLTLAIDALTRLAGSVNLGSSTLSTIQTLCSSLPANYQFCSITDPATFDVDEVKGIRTLLKEDNVIGLGADCDGDISTCNCP